VLLTLALLGIAGAAEWQRTESLLLAVTSGVCCAIVATLITLCFAISFNLFLRHVWTGNCARPVPPAACSIEQASGEEYPGSVVGNTCSYASLSHLLGLCWSHHPRTDEPPAARLYWQPDSWPRLSL
jgi:hypothetical protein